MNQEHGFTCPLAGWKTFQERNQSFLKCYMLFPARFFKIPDWMLCFSNGVAILYHGRSLCLYSLVSNMSTDLISKQNTVINHHHTSPTPTSGLVIHLNSL